MDIVSVASTSRVLGVDCLHAPHVLYRCYVSLYIVSVCDECLCVCAFVRLCGLCLSVKFKCVRPHLSVFLFLYVCMHLQLSMCVFVCVYIVVCACACVCVFRVIVLFLSTCVAHIVFATA